MTAEQRRSQALLGNPTKVNMNIKTDLNSYCVETLSEETRVCLHSSTSLVNIQ